MRIWTVLSQKGGSGKTTLVLHLGVAAIEMGWAVSIINSDPQRSAEKWADLREQRVGKPAPAIVHGLLHDIEPMIAEARNVDTDLVLIDTPPATNNTTLRAGGVANMIIVPTRSSTLDVEALRETLQALHDSGKLGRAVIVMNAADADKSGAKAIETMARSAFKVPILPVRLKQANALAQSLGTGKGITERSPNSVLAETVTDLLAELVKQDRRIERARKRENA